MCVHSLTNIIVVVTIVVKYIMHKLKLEFHPVTNIQAIDALVFALSIDLFVHNRIECTQPSHDVLEFESARDCAFAQLVLCGNSRYTVTSIV